MQTGRGRGHRSSLLRENGLIALAIRARVRPANVRRQGHVPHSFENVKQIAAREQANRALAMLAARQNFRRQVFGDDDSLAGAHLAAGLHQRFPGKPSGETGLVRNTSTRPVPCSRRPWSRDGNTRESFNTRQSPGFR